MDVTVAADKLELDDRTMRCAIGAGGLTQDKKEGDKATPIGRFALRQVFYRQDRIKKPSSRLPIRAIQPSDGWCDDATDPKYNQLISLPYSGSHETLWRDDHIYDLLVVVGYNDHPAVAGAGSAIFIHVASDEYSPTSGCIALNFDDLLFVVEHLTEESNVIVVNG